MYQLQLSGHSDHSFSENEGSMSTLTSYELLYVYKAKNMLHTNRSDRKQTVITANTQESPNLLQPLPSQFHIQPRFRAYMPCSIVLFPSKNIQLFCHAAYLLQKCHPITTNHTD